MAAATISAIRLKNGGRRSPRVTKGRPVKGGKLADLDAQCVRVSILIEIGGGVVDQGPPVGGVQAGRAARRRGHPVEIQAGTAFEIARLEPGCDRVEPSAQLGECGELGCRELPAVEQIEQRRFVDRTLSGTSGLPAARRRAIRAAERGACDVGAPGAEQVDQGCQVIDVIVTLPCPGGRRSRPRPRRS